MVTAISRSEAKKELATRAGADHYLATAAASQMEAARNSVDIILDTIPTDHDISPYRSLLASQASKLVILGINANFTGAFVARKLLGNICRVQISGIGGIAATQEVIELCDQAEPKILPEIKIMPVHELNSIFECLAETARGLGICPSPKVHLWLDRSWEVFATRRSTSLFEASLNPRTHQVSSLGLQ